MFKRKAPSVGTNAYTEILTEEDSDRTTIKNQMPMMEQSANILQDNSFVSDINLLKNSNKFSEIYKMDDFAAGVSSEIYLSSIFADKPELQEK